MMTPIDYERRWQMLKAWLSDEAEECKDWILTIPLLSGDELKRLHARIHAFADVKAYMEKIEVAAELGQLPEEKEASE